MKKIIKLIIFLILTLPITIYAKETYDEAKNKVNGYLSRIDANHRFKDFDKYILFPENNSHFWNTAYDTGFLKGGLLNREEYLITNVNNNSYLANGFGFWTLTGSGSNRYTIDYVDKSVSKTSKSGTKVTEFVKQKTKVTGSGKINEPWEFSELYKVIVSIKNGGASLSSSSQVDYVTKYVYSGENITLPIYLQNNYEFDSLGTNVIYNNGNITINNITGDRVVALEPAPTIVEYSFNYTGGEQTLAVPRTGYYKLEVWGAQGGGYGSTTGSYRGGYGGYSVGTVNLTSGQTLYINVGGAGISQTTKSASSVAGGYNGGGNSYGEPDKYVGSGGGATHIATSSGVLSSLSSNTSSVLIVAGGGGGGAYQDSANNSIGGSGGGKTGTDSTSSNQSWTTGKGGTQTAGGSGYQGSSSFGIGASATGNAEGGGGGYYGGGCGQYFSGGGGGSGYIGNSLLSSKSMYCYNCTADSAATTKTISTTNVSETATANYTKIGNGYARITFIN